jgi:hypothetical protein
MKTIISFLFCLRFLDASAAQSYVATNGISINGTLFNSTSNDTTGAGLTNNTMWGALAAKTYIDRCMDSSNGFMVKMYDKTGLLSVTPKIFSDTFVVNSANDFALDISGAAFTNVLFVGAIGIKSTGTATNVPQVAVNSFTSNVVYLDFTQGNSALPVLMVLFPGTIYISNFTGLKVALTVIGY